MAEQITYPIDHLLYNLALFRQSYHLRKGIALTLSPHLATNSKDGVLVMKFVRF
ncbi:MAG: hypothetical protein ACJAYK_002982 [Crocinitomicaceae bacterium]